MKKRSFNYLILWFLILISVIPKGSSAQQMSKSEKEYLLNYLHQTKENFVKSIKGLSTAQWTFKSDSSRWSPAECSEHIIKAEGMLRGYVTDSILTKPVDPANKAEIKVKTEDIAKMIEDRSKKFKTSEMLMPTNAYSTPDDAIKAFDAARQKTIDFVKHTDADMHGHVGAAPFGMMDAYQWLVFLTAHSARHTKQIMEVEMTAGYPKK
ncbi:DinB family protein [Solitalea lacus]|uniref:DinB family protein n=1 Tax=Solitalea lacus TaxID=2911172 RepID=UPI001EDC7354|nr:DinB family protein [Solitalea lacus]UKJ08773.1 DinB family protein [Solitalea lacus]